MFTPTPKRTEEQCSSGCCSPKPKRKATCPRCGQVAKEVHALTLSHLLTQEALFRVEGLEGWHYCKMPSCDVVYFREKALMLQEDIKVPVGLKEGVSPAPVCYCFGWTKEMIAAALEAHGRCDALEDIKAKMIDPGCDCERLNPSGACCLGDVSKVIKALEAQRL